MLERRIFIATAASVAIFGCSTAYDASSTRNTGDKSELIINGTPVTEDAYGSVLLSNGCSGTRLSAQVILTAHHCLTQESVRTGGTPVIASSIKATLLNGVSAIGAVVYLHPSLDLGILTLLTPLPDETPVGDPPIGIFGGADADLAGQTLYCEGWGDNTFTTGGNVLRWARLNVSNAEDGGYKVVPNANGQVDWLGDSGSSCFIPYKGMMAITGVQSTCEYNGTLNVSGNVTSCHQVGIADTRSWIQGVVGSLPSVSSMAPARGGAGTLVTLQGANLTGGLVMMGGLLVPGASCTSSVCTFKAPASVGTYQIAVNVAGNIAAAGPFTYEPPPACTYAFNDTPSDGECDGAVNVYCPAAFSAFQNGTSNPDPVTVYKGSSINGPWVPFWNVGYGGTTANWPKVSESAGSTVYLMACTGGSAPGDCDAPVAVQVARYACSTCTPLKCTAGAGVMCGHASDGCGGFIECGNCNAGSTCDSDNFCTAPACTTDECKCTQSGGIWSSDSNVCIHCKTEACACAASGGAWNGHSCQ